jgi:hypothetical protein
VVHHGYDDADDLMGLLPAHLDVSIDDDLVTVRIAVTPYDRTRID